MIIDCNVKLDTDRDTIDDFLRKMKKNGVDVSCVALPSGRMHSGEANAELQTMVNGYENLIPVGKFEYETLFGLIDAQPFEGFRIIDLRDVPHSSLAFREAASYLDKRGTPFITAANAEAAVTLAALDGIYIPVILTGAHYSNLNETMLLMRKKENVLVEISKLTVPEGIEFIVTAFGSRRVVMGSGYPECSVASAVMNVEKSNIKDDDKERILSGNMKEILSI